MELYYSLSVLIVLASVFAYINHRFLKLPSAIGIMLIAILASVVFRLVGPKLFPDTTNDLYNLISGFDFTELLMGAMLNFLLFAGAIHVNFADLKEQRWPIIAFSTLSVIISTVVVATILFYVKQWFGLNIPFIYCLLFGALISPTDPIAVLGILKKAKVPKSLETKIAGESLFNDGVAVVLFAVLLQVAQNPEVEVSFGSVSWLLIQEAVGGIALGAALGFVASKAIKSIDDYVISVLITLSVVMGGYLAAVALHVSGPLTMVIAGLIIGNYAKRVAMSDITKDYLAKFWELIDEVLNAILFLFIGFELIMIKDIEGYWLISVFAIFVVLFARTISILLPSFIMPAKQKFSKATLTLLVWGGLRGGVSIALVFMVKDFEYREIFLEMTYFVVVFSILVQGLSVGNLAKKVLK